MLCTCGPSILFRLAAALYVKLGHRVIDRENWSLSEDLPAAFRNARFGEIGFIYGNISHPTILVVLPHFLLSLLS
jgi:hypothetical protein